MKRSNMRIYDNGGKTFDRYTVVFMDNEESKGLYYAVGMSAHPFAPGGFGQHTSAAPGRHLGKRLNFEKLPADCQKMVNSEFDLSLDQFKQELRMNDVKGDPWGVCMSAWFQCAAVLYERDYVPSEWGYSVGAAGNCVDEEDYFTEMFQECTIEQLHAIGEYLNRIVNILEKKGLNY